MTNTFNCQISSHHDDLFESDQAIANRLKKFSRRNKDIAHPINIGNKILCSSDIIHEETCWIVVGDAAGIAHKVAIYSKDSFNKSNNIISKYKGHNGPISSIAVYKNFVLTGSWDKTIRQFTHDGQCIKMYEGHTDYVKSIIIQPIISNCHNKEILFHSGSADGKCISWKDNEHTSAKLFQRSIEQIIHHPYNDEICFAVSSDGNIKFLSMEYPLKEIATLKGHETSVYCACIDHEREILYTGSADKTIAAWNMHTFQIEFIVNCNDWIRSMDVDPFDGLLYVGTREGYLLVIDPFQQIILNSLDGHCDEITSIHVYRYQDIINDSIPFVFTCSLDGTIRQWSSRDIKQLPDTIPTLSLCTEEEERAIKELLEI